MRLKILSLVLSTPFLLQAQEVKELKWGDLVPKFRAIEDPFEKLSPEVQQNLSTVASYRTLEEYSPESVSESIQMEKDSLESWLSHEGVAVDSLIADRLRIAELNQERARGIVRELEGMDVKIPGYMLPLDYSAERVTEFLLVPWVGACIHTPPPPRNQIIYVRLATGYSHKSIYEAVWVSGKITTGNRTTKLYLVDGSDDISSGYSILDSQVSPYKGNK